MHVYIYQLYMHTYVATNRQTHVSIYLQYQYIYIYMYIYIYVYMYVYIYMYTMYTCRQSQVHTAYLYKIEIDGYRVGPSVYPPTSSAMHVQPESFFPIRFILQGA